MLKGFFLNPPAVGFIRGCFFLRKWFLLGLCVCLDSSAHFKRREGDVPWDFKLHWENNKASTVLQNIYLSSCSVWNCALGYCPWGKDYIAQWFTTVFHRTAPLPLQINSWLLRVGLETDWPDFSFKRAKDLSPNMCRIGVGNPFHPDGLIPM